MLVSSINLFLLNKPTCDECRGLNLLVMSLAVSGDVHRGFVLAFVCLISCCPYLPSIAPYNQVPQPFASAQLHPLCASTSPLQLARGKTESIPSTMASSTAVFAADACSAATSSTISSWTTLTSLASSPFSRRSSAARAASITSAAPPWTGVFRNAVKYEFPRFRLKVLTRPEGVWTLCDASANSAVRRCHRRSPG